MSGRTELGAKPQRARCGRTASGPDNLVCLESITVDFKAFQWSSPENMNQLLSSEKELTVRMLS